MADKYKKFKEKAFSAFRGLASEFPQFEDAEMLVGGAESQASLVHQDTYKNIDTEWIDAIEKALPSLDIIVRNPTVAIEDVDEVLPVELSRHITEKSIKHLAQHTNLIMSVKENGEVVPKQLLNVYHDETLLTYENKFINTLLARLYAFVDKRYRALMSSSGVERNYKFDYQTEFEHLLPDNSGKNLARIHLNIELTSPLNDESEANLERKDKYIQAIQRVKRINMALISYQSSAFAQALGRNYIRPPVVRTNAILKNKNFKECLTLWEFIESFDKVGYTVRVDAEKEMPSGSYIGDLYSSVAFQYTNFYYDVVGNEDKRLLSEKHLFDVDPDFDADFSEEELQDYQVYDSEYKKTVPVSRLMNNRKKLSEDEKRIHRAMWVALKADEILNAEMKAAEAEMKRLARQRRLEEEEKRRAEEAERARLAALLTQMPIAVRYRRSFLSRYIQADQSLQTYYGKLKNQLLGYEGVKSRISWKADRFSKGRECLARMDVRGKRVYLYLALDPAEFKNTKYRCADVREQRPDTPMLVKIKGSLGFLHATQLVEKLAEKFGLTQITRAVENYDMPYEDNETLIGKGLIKVVFPKGVAVEDGQILTKENLRDFFEGRSKKLEFITPTDEMILPPPQPIAVRYRRSFRSRYIQSDEGLQKYYERLKNQLLAHEGIRSRISWKGDKFYKGRKCVAKMDVRGKRLCLYLALDPVDFNGTKYRHASVGDKNADTPMLVKIKGSLGFLHATQLVEKLVQKLGLIKTDRADESYTMPYEDNDALIAKGLIKIVYPKGVKAAEGQILTKADFKKFFQTQEPVEEMPLAEIALTQDQEQPQALPVEEQAQGLLVEEGIEQIPEKEEEASLLEEGATTEEKGELAPVAEEEASHEATEQTMSEEEPLSAIEKVSVAEQVMQGEDSAQGRYKYLRATLLAYGAIPVQKGKIEEFSYKGRVVAKIEWRWKKLQVYLALSSKEAPAGQYPEGTFAKKQTDTPMRLKIRGQQDAQSATVLIAFLMQKLGV